MAQAFPNAFALDQPEGSARKNSYAADAFIEPWLLKHSEFYRKHLTRDGRRESKAGRRASQIAVESRKNSLEAAAEPTPGAVAAAETASERGADSIEEERLQQKKNDPKEEKKGWRRHLHF